MTIHKKDKNLKGEIHLSGSKSISNRVLMIKALSGNDFAIEHLSDSDDTLTLQRLLVSEDDILDCHHAGTTFRFLTAYLGIGDKEVILTGSDRMQQRPIGPLVDALRQIGCEIDYLKNDGFPPLKIKPFQGQISEQVTIDASVSSQYISAMMLIAPYLPKGLKLNFTGNIVSKSYIEMTLKTMAYFGIEYSTIEDGYKIRPQKYESKDFFVEGDWSAASYYYEMAAFCDDVDIVLHGLEKESLQGDQAIVQIGEKFGLATTFENQSVRIQKVGKPAPFLEYDFINCPDIAQSVSVMCGGLGIQGLFSGLKTLSIKETDRVQALQNELSKTGVFLTKMPSKFSQKSGVEYFMQEGKSSLTENISFATYQDHRMAMSLAPMSILGEITIENPEVVSKSYPLFWKDLESLGFEII